MRTINEWRRLWNPDARPEGHTWWCEQVGYGAHCSEASVLIHPERHRACGWRQTEWFGVGEGEKPMSDQLKAALVWWDATARFDPAFMLQGFDTFVEAARLVADPDTLIVEKTNGEWPDDVVETFARGMHAHWQEDQDDPEHVWARLSRLDQEFMEAQAVAALDALLAYQGDTE